MSYFKISTPEAIAAWEDLWQKDDRLRKEGQSFADLFGGKAVFINDLVCFTYQPCQYEPQGWIYPDQANCQADIREQKLPPQYECLPVEAILPASKM